MFSKFYFSLLLLCCISGAVEASGVLISVLKLPISPNINPDFLTVVCWITYTQSYLFFLTSYYKELLQPWQIKVCYLINFINFIAQLVDGIPYSFDLGMNPELNMKVIDVAENISATSTVLSETVLTIWIFSLIFGISKKTVDPKAKQMLIKVLLTMSFIWALDVIVIFLEYSGREVFAYITKPMILSFKFFIELLILGHCKKQLFLISGLENW